MKKIVQFLALLTFCLGIGSAYAQDLSKFKKENFIYGADTLKYRILYPENFDASKKYPLLFFLHGRGESGNDNEKQLTHGSKMFLAQEFREKYPAIVVFPQCAEQSYWANVAIEAIQDKRFFTFVKGGQPTLAMNLLVQFTRKMGKEPFVNSSQMYVGGLSMGGMGTLEVLRRLPNTFAAAFSICGGDHVANVKKYKNVPLWLFHGGLDDVVSPQFSYAIMRELRKQNKEPKFTLYLKANHNSWDAAFAEPELFPWLFSHHK